MCGDTWTGHLPIRDVSVPGPDFEQAWQQHSPGLRARLRDGFDVVVHCKGGLGRAGTIAARLLIELGMEPAQAIGEVRQVRSGAIETRAQEHYVLSHAPLAEPAPSTSDEAVRDRALGALLGLAVGDAVGTTLEFKQRDSYPRLTDMVGGGPFHLKPGQWTDDTSMALALADSLLAEDGFDPADLMRRFVAWREEGEYSCTGNCFDIGITVSSALSHWHRSGDPIAGSTDPKSAGNGSLMRLSPVAIRHWRDRETLRHIAALQSRTTHGAPEAVSACVAYAELIADAIAGQPRQAVLAPRQTDHAGRIAEIMGGSWRGAMRHDIGSSGYVAHSLEAALWSIGRTSDFRSAILTAANLGGDADTTAAIAGQLAGALYG
ncbi:MAG: ADP-ribosylglycohydrolase family protein, partial [Erythrobacteraceae bacterium]